MSRENQLGENYLANGGIYHVISRVVWREFVFGDEEKEFIRSTLRRYEKFCGVQILSYCIMSNHFHVLVKVPPRPDEMMDDESFFTVLSSLYSRFYVDDVRRKIESLRDEGGDDIEHFINGIKEQYSRRMWSLSEFMKGVKQSVTSWYNRRAGKRGTLWEGRYKSVLVQGGFAAKMTSAYIDLNPLRAGIVKDPVDYRWCSYAEAVSGQRLAKRGVLAVMNVRELGIKEEIDASMTQTEALRVYRMLLAEEGQENGHEEGDQLIPGQSVEKLKKRQKGFCKEEVEKILESKGKLSWAQVLRCRTRYFCDGLVIGSKEFIDDYFTGLKARTGAYEKRETGARKMKVAGEQLHTMRNLVKDVFS